MKKLLIPLIVAVLQLLPQMACPQDIEGDVFVDPNQPEIDSLLNDIKLNPSDSLKKWDYNHIAFITTNNDTCLKYALLSLEYCLPTDSLIIATNYDNIAYVYYMKDESRKALPYRFKAADIYNKISYKSYEATTFLNIARCYEDLNIKDSVFYFYNKALKYFTEAQDTVRIITIYNDLGRIYTVMSLYANAEEMQRKALSYAIASNDTLKTARCYGKIGGIYAEKSDSSIADAIKYLSKAVRIYESTKVVNYIYVSNKYQVYMSLASAYVRAAQYTGKKEYADSCLIYIKKIGNYYLTTGSDHNYLTSQYNFVDYLYFYKRYNDALSELLRLGKYITNDAPVFLLRSYNRYLYDVYSKLGDYRYALKYHEKYMEYAMANVNDSALNVIKNAEVERTRMLDSISHHYETLRIEAEHQQEMTRARTRTRVLLSIALVFILVGVILFFYYRAAKENEENKLRNKALEVERSLLRTQMNPHFIFNALNSVQSFIMGNNMQDAVRFLSKFAKLMRMILNNSMVQSVKLSDEMESLSLYLDLERARFGNRFNYCIDIDDNVEEDLVSVPPMLIQPFIENAIIHGLMHKTDGEGLISISIAENDSDSLICRITDNGVGRKAAAEIEKGRERKHKSVGMQLTRDRLRDLNSESNARMSCVITDLEDEGGKALGTQVTIIIPLVEDENA